MDGVAADAACPYAPRAFDLGWRRRQWYCKLSVVTEEANHPQVAELKAWPELPEGAEVIYYDEDPIIVRAAYLDGRCLGFQRLLDLDWVPWDGPSGLPLIPPRHVDGELAAYIDEVERFG